MHLLPPRTLLAVVVLAAVSPALGAQERQRWSAPELDRAIAVRDGRSGEALTFPALLDALAEADAVFLGEIHTDETTHRVELGVYAGLVAHRSGKVVLAMEMFERDVQGALEAYLAGETTEEQFLAASRPWSNYDSGYRPLIEFAKSRKLPVVASNFPKPLRMRLAMMGDGATLDALGENERALAPKELFPNGPDYWRRVDNATRGHGAFFATPDDDERLYSTQSLWDNSMGEACAIALDEHPGSSVVHVNGGFHSAYWDGTVRQLRLRKPDAKIVTVAVMPSSNPAVADPRGAPVADYVVYAEKRATDRNDDKFSVYVQDEIEYRLHLPRAAQRGESVPLLIWLADDGLTAKDGMALWQQRLGAECAIAVVEAPYRETQDDLVEGGRWFWPDTFTEDVESMGAALEKIWAFLLRHYALDPNRVCIAGEGTGATIVSAVSLRSERISARAVGFAPRRYAKLKDIPLPLPELRGDAAPPEKSLRLHLTPADEAWWSGELAEYETIGFAASATALPSDPWLVESELEATVRTALGLPVTAPADDAPRRHVVATSQRARLWARLRGAREAGRDGALVAILGEPPAAGASTPIEVNVHPRDYASGFRIPRCPGPFGGSTVVVMPKSTPAETVEAWLAIERDDPLNKMSRFHRVRIATTDGERELADVLAALAEKGRKNVLIVPATFCADGETMRALRLGVREMEDQMTLRWLPGLGG
ncbi:MAG: hypothetical protein GY711_25175 [bacterium]|nr:hypothetical protein [bacterium]